MLINKICRLKDYIINLILLRCRNVEIRIKDIKNIRGKIYIKNEGKIIIGTGVNINSGYQHNAIGGDCRTIICTSPNSLVEIGENTGISNSAIISFNKVIIGKNVMIGGSCKIYDTDFHSLDVNVRKMDDNKILSKPIEIRDGCFIGACSIILKGVIIGENSVIGAGSVVTRNIPANEVWAGNPARFIRRV